MTSILGHGALRKSDIFMEYKTERNAKIYNEWAMRGRSFADIGREYELSRDRIREIVKREGKRRANKH